MMSSRGGVDLRERLGERQQRVEVLLVLRRDEDRARWRTAPGCRPRSRARAWRSSSSTGSHSSLSRVDQPQDRPGHERRHERHHDEHREELRRDHAEVEPDVEHDQLGQAARVHQRADRGRVAQAEAAVARREPSRRRTCPTIATAIRSSVISQSSGRLSALTSVLRPVTTKKSGSRTRTTKFSKRSRDVGGQAGAPRHDQPHDERSRRSPRSRSAARRTPRAARRRRSTPSQSVGTLADLVVGLRDAAEQPPADQQHRRREDGGQRDDLERVRRARRCRRPPPRARAGTTRSRRRSRRPPSTSAPTGRFSIRRSIRIRASTGKAVTDIATPMKSANGR